MTEYKQPISLKFEMPCQVTGMAELGSRLSCHALLTRIVCKIVIRTSSHACSKTVGQNLFHAQRTFA